MTWSRVACSGLVLLASACARTAGGPSIHREETGAAAIASSESTAPDVRCLISASKVRVRASVHHGEGYYPTHNTWSLERSGADVRFSRNEAHRELSPAAARHLIEHLVGIVADRTKDPGDYKTATASVHWQCDSAPEARVRYSAVDPHSDHAAPTTHVGRIEHAFEQASGGAAK